MNNLKGLLEFVSVVEAGSFSKAAENISVTVSQVSKRITELEEHLGTRLLFRTTRSVKPSPAGLTFYESCKKILDEYQLAQDRIGENQKGAQGCLKLAYVGGSRPDFQVEIMAGFLKRYPLIQIEALYLDTIPNLVEEGIDLALVVGEIGDCNSPALRVAWADHGLCASPAYLKKAGDIKHPCELEDHACIINSSSTWQLNNNTEEVEVEVEGRWKSLNVRSCINACINDLGVCLVPIHAIPEATAGGKLVHVLPEWYSRKPIYGVSPNREYVPAKIHFLLDYMKEMLNVVADGKEGLETSSSRGDSLMNIIQQMSRTVEQENIK